MQSSAVMSNRADISAAVARIAHFERIFNRLLTAYARDPDSIGRDGALKEQLLALLDYYENGAWLSDYLLDEAGRIPADLPRGVLSQDGVWNFITEPEITQLLKENTMEEQNLHEVMTSSEEIFNGRILRVCRDMVRLPNGHETSRELIRHVGAVAVVAMTDDKQVIIERQFRYPLGQVITEIPAGKLDSKEENRLDAAKRELREETGYTADVWVDLGDYYPAAAYTDERISLYLARGLHRGEQELDEDEFLNFTLVPLDELVEAVLRGEITDGKTQAAVLKVKLRGE